MMNEAIKTFPYRCPNCGRLDPYNRRPCFCQESTMQSKEKDILLFYEHHTDGHPFGNKLCPACNSNAELYRR